MLRIGRDTRGLFLYEDNGIAGAIGTVILVPIAMVLGPPVLIAFFLFSLGTAGVVSGVAMSVISLVSFYLSSKAKGKKKKVVCAWYGSLISLVYAVTTVYSIHVRADWGFFTWVAMGICALALFCIGICICDEDGLFALTALSLLLSWLFSMALVYSIQHGRALPSYIYMMVGLPVALQFLMALLRSLGLLAGIGKAS